MENVWGFSVHNIHRHGWLKSVLYIMMPWLYGCWCFVISVFQMENGAEVEAEPKKDYSIMPLLAAPPQVGQRIAFKVRTQA